MLCDQLSSMAWHVVIQVGWELAFCVMWSIMDDMLIGGKVHTVHFSSFEEFTVKHLIVGVILSLFLPSAVSAAETGYPPHLQPEKLYQ